MTLSAGFPISSTIPIAIVTSSIIAKVGFYHLVFPLLILFLCISTIPIPIVTSAIIANGGFYYFVFATLQLHEELLAVGEMGK